MEIKSKMLAIRKLGVFGLALVINNTDDNVKRKILGEGGFGKVIEGYDLLISKGEGKNTPFATVNLKRKRAIKSVGIGGGRIAIDSEFKATKKSGALDVQA